MAKLEHRQNMLRNWQNGQNLPGVRTVTVFMAVTVETVTNEVPTPL